MPSTSMDFFSNVGNSNSDPPPTESFDPFAQAIATRFGSGSLLTARLMQEKSPPRDSFSSPARKGPSPAIVPLPSTPMAKMTLVSPQALMSFTPVSPAALRDILNDHSNVLILDIRPHAAFTAARIPRALSLCVPSTLLKRPLFSLEKLSEMLPSTVSRESFCTWRTASRIIVYDADAAAIPEGSNINGLLKKFKKEGFTGDLGWLQGGFQAIWRTQRDLISSDPPSPETEPEDAATSPFIPAASAPPGVLRTRQLPMSAFTQSSTTSASSKPNLKLTRSATTAGLILAPSRPAANPFFDTIRQNTELSQGITERIPLKLPRRVRHRISDLPFRWLQDIARRSVARSRTAAELASSDLSSEDESDDEINATDVEEGTEALAMQFYRIELAEQRRLLGIMEHHSKESGPTDSQPRGAYKGPEHLDFPYSITAGVEKGAKNRYRNIWPFEHARVRLHQRHHSNGAGSPEDDYVNASYVQPLGTSRRYIATQGPLPETFTDFWTLCWEQNVHVIVMLTREIEGAMVKCGNYWSSSSYGPLRLKLISTSGASPSMSVERDVTMDFLAPPKKTKNTSSTTIKRVFELTNTKFPASKPRIVTHLQYLEWPDMNVPDDPRDILGLIKEVDIAVAASSPSAACDDADTGKPVLDGTLDRMTGVARHALGKRSPVLLHCSAGVGRTGGFIAVDALLDAVRREIKKKKSAERAKASSGGEKSSKVDKGDAMDVDSPIMGTVPLHHNAKDKHREEPADEGFIVHVPNPSRDADTLKAPLSHHNRMIIDMQDEMESENSSDYSPNSVPLNSPWVQSRPGPSTRRWAEAVSDETGVTGGGMRDPNANFSSTTSSNSNSNSSSYLNLPLSPAVVPIDVPTSDSRRKLSFPTTDSSSSVPSRNSSDSLGLSNLSADQPSSSVATTMSDKSHGSLRPSQEVLKQLNVKSGFAEPSELKSTESAEALNTKSTTSNPSSIVEQSRAEHHLSESPQPMTRSGAWATFGSTTDRSKGSSMGSHGSVQPPPSTLSSVSRSASLWEPTDQRRSSRSESSGYPPGVAFGSRSFSDSSPISLADGSYGSVKKPVTAKSHLAETFSSDENVSSSDDVRAFIVDYKQPRPLHADCSPTALSTYEEPVWQVIHDMREQRMSLCQSLRQYVFVHAALIEGALIIVDEERGVSEKGSSLGSGSSTISAGTRPSPSPGSSTNTGSQSNLTPSVGKRGASPTELLKKDKKGQLSLAKRPSMKRKQSSPGGRGVTFNVAPTESLPAGSGAAASW